MIVLGAIYGLVATWAAVSLVLSGLALWQGDGWRGVRLVWAISLAVVLVASAIAGLVTAGGYALGVYR